MRRPIHRRRLVLVLTACLATLLGMAARPNPQRTTPPPVTGSLQLAERTDAGNWDGTWYYTNRDARVALWLRTENGVPIYQLQFANISTLEGFITDWQGSADYTFRRAQCKFRLEPKERDANTIRARWDWLLEASGFVRHEQGDVTMYRTEMGRYLVMLFENWEHLIVRDGVEHRNELDQSWTFRKASNRQITWDEIPF